MNKKKRNQMKKKKKNIIKIMSQMMNLKVKKQKVFVLIDMI